MYWWRTNTINILNTFNILRHTKKSIWITVSFAYLYIHRKAAYFTMDIVLTAWMFWCFFPSLKVNTSVILDPAYFATQMKETFFFKITLIKTCCDSLFSNINCSHLGTGWAIIPHRQMNLSLLCLFLHFWAARPNFIPCKRVGSSSYWT